MQKRPGLAALTALCVGMAGCGYPTFQFGQEGAGGTVSASSSRASSQAVTSSQTASSSSTGGMASSTGTASTSTAASSTGGPPPCGIGHLVISDIQTSGKNGAMDEFVTLYNPTENPITIDSSWTLKTAPPSSGGSYQKRWTGGTGPSSIPAHGHYLIVGPDYSGSVMADDMLSSSLRDEASLVLYVNISVPVDAVCYYTGTDSGGYDGLGYTCAGVPVHNPQDGSTVAMIDRSIARKPGSGMGNCTDSNDNATDFTVESPSVPENTASPPN